MIRIISAIVLGTVITLFMFMLMLLAQFLVGTVGIGKTFIVVLLFVVMTGVVYQELGKK